jgi:hypothetical protein
MPQLWQLPRLERMCQQHGTKSKNASLGEVPVSGLNSTLSFSNQGKHRRVVREQVGRVVTRQVGRGVNFFTSTPNQASQIAGPEYSRQVLITTL